MIEVPSHIKYIELYITLRCNLRCPYCINFTNNRLRQELECEKWVNFINDLDIVNNLPITFGGGEPTQYPYFFDLIAGIKKNKIDILTNLQFDEREFIKKVDTGRFKNIDTNTPYKSIRASYHPMSVANPISLVERARCLQDAGFSIGIFGINHPLNMEANIKMAEIARQYGVYFFIKDFLGLYKGKLFGYFKYDDALFARQKIRKCKVNELLVGPDGGIFKCHRDLYENENPVNNILNENVRLEDMFRFCKHYGSCNPCDVKIKTDASLKSGVCNMEVIDGTHQ